MTSCSGHRLLTALYDNHLSEREGPKAAPKSFELTTPLRARNVYFGAQDWHGAPPVSNTVSSLTIRPSRIVKMVTIGSSRPLAFAVN